MKQITLLIFLFCMNSCNSKKDGKSLNQLKSDSLSKRSEYYIANNKLDSAEYFIEQALILDSTNYAAYDNSAVLKYRQNKPSVEVVKDFETSLRLNPGNETALFSLVNYYDEISDYKKAIEVGNHYVFQYKWDKKSDSSHMEIIKRIISKAGKYEKLHLKISFTMAMAFYDSINAILKKSDSVQQRFINNVAAEMMRMLNDKHSNSGIDYLDKVFDSAVSINEIEIKKISMISEIDSNVNYKNAALNYCLVFQKAYKNKFAGFLFCLKSKDWSLIKNCMASIKPSLFDIRAEGKKLDVSAAIFKKKYQITPSDE